MPGFRGRRALFGVAALTCGLFSCQSILGFDDFVVREDAGNGGQDATTTDGGGGGGDGATEASCNVDLATTCYACTPQSTDQYLNACTEAQCLPFDRTRILPLLTADGGLPPIPDGGVN
jgi:hypothetical protein